MSLEEQLANTFRRWESQGLEIGLQQKRWRRWTYKGLCVITGSLVWCHGPVLPSSLSFSASSINLCSVWYPITLKLSTCLSFSTQWESLEGWATCDSPRASYGVWHRVGISKFFVTQQKSCSSLFLASAVTVHIVCCSMYGCWNISSSCVRLSNSSILILARS